MKTIAKMCAMIAIAATMAFTANTASAAEAPELKAPLTALTGGAALTAKGLIARTPAPTPIKVAGRRGRGLAAGIIAGVVGAAILSGAARAHHRHRHYYHDDYAGYRGYRRCERWFHKCDYGHRWACRKFYRYCD